MLLKAISKIYSSFLSLLDTPSSYSGQGGKYVKVNTGETGLEFGDELWTKSGSDIYYNTGNVGIGTATPNTPLDVGSGVFQATGNYVGAGTTITKIKSVVGSTSTPESDNDAIAIFQKNSDSTVIGSSVNPTVYASISKNGVATGSENKATAIFCEAQDNVGGSGSFVEGIKSHGVLNWGASGSAYGVIAMAGTGSGIDYNFLIACEAEVWNNNGVNPAIPFNSAKFSAAFLASLRSPNSADVAFLVNPYNTLKYNYGFYTDRSLIGAEIKGFSNYGINIPSRTGTGPSISVASGAGRAEFLSGIKVGNFTETASAGAMKYDATNSFQGYHNGTWGALGGDLASFGIDGGAYSDTYISTANVDAGAY